MRTHNKHYKNYVKKKLKEGDKKCSAFIRHYERGLTIGGKAITPAKQKTTASRALSKLRKNPEGERGSSEIAKAVEEIRKSLGGQKETPKNISVSAVPEGVFSNIFNVRDPSSAQVGFYYGVLDGMNNCGISPTSVLKRRRLRKQAEAEIKRANIEFAERLAKGQSNQKGGFF